MLTTTYSITVLSSEQQNARRILETVEQWLHNGIRKGAGGIDRGWLEKMFNKLLMIDKYCRERKVERYVIPAIRKTSTDADALLDRLHSLSVYSIRILKYAYDQLQRITDGEEVDAAGLISAMDIYCKQMLERLSLEESELFPIACRMLSPEEWFRIAAQCLSHERKRPASFNQNNAPGVPPQEHHEPLHVDCSLPCGAI